MPILASYIVPHPPLIIPEIGNGREQTVEETIDSYHKISKEINNINPDTIIITSPHAQFSRNGFWISKDNTMTGNFETFGAKEVSFEEKIDTELANEIIKEAKLNNIDIETNSNNLDHGTMVPLYYINKYLNNKKIICIGLSLLSLDKHYELGKIIKNSIDKTDKKVVFVASGDLSHKLKENGPYGFIEEGPLYDELLLECIKNKDLIYLKDFKVDFLDKASECGHRSFTIMSGIWDNINIKTKIYSHEDITGVGYGICSIYPINRSIYVDLAYKSIKYFLENNKYMEIPINTPSELINNRSGVFVSIHKNKALRGCIGTITPVYGCIAEEIIYNAVSASINDPRFNRIELDEYNDLEISVDILSESEDINSLDELDPNKYGIIVYNDERRGLLLPNIDGVEDIATQISIAKQKAGIYDDNYRIKRFTVTRYY